MTTQEHSTSTPAGQPGDVRATGPVGIRLLRAEYLKIVTTHAWWIVGGCALLITALALLINCVNASQQFDQAKAGPPLGDGPPAPAPGEPGPTGSPAPGEPGAGRDSAELLAEWHRQFDPAPLLIRNAAAIYTSGQLFGVLLVMLLGVIMVTSEFHHQTATATFLTTPRRTDVIIAKFAMAVGLAAALWLALTAIDVGVGTLVLHAHGLGTGLDRWPVLRSVLLNLLAFAVWAVFGVGIGALIRNQVGATIAAAGLYLVAGGVALVAFQILYGWTKQDWVLTASVVVPSIASQIMTSPQRLFDQAPPQWVGAAVLIGYAILSTAVGAAIIRRRDVS
jgi:ABC-2 type transport system permease protein